VRIVRWSALAASVLACLALLAAGIFLAGISQLGERGAGLLILAGTIVAMVAAGYVLFAPPAFFSGRARRPLAIIAAFLACAPAAVLALIAFLFVGIPYGSTSPALDWSVFTAGIVFALGAICILLSGYWRVVERPPAGRIEWDEDVKVRRI
jgi:hypothetical protein